MRHLSAEDYVRPATLIAELLDTIKNLELELAECSSKIDHYERIITAIQDVTKL